MIIQTSSKICGFWIRISIHVSLALRLSLTSTWPWFTLIDAQMVGLPEYYMTSLRVSNQNHKNKLSKTKQIAIHGHKNDMTSTIISMGPLAQSALLPPVSKGSQSDSPTCAEKKGFQKRRGHFIGVWWDLKWYRNWCSLFSRLKTHKISVWHWWNADWW